MMKYCFASLFLTFGWSVCGQDFQFSQFYAVPMSVNAASTGHLEAGNQRITLAYRGQWDQPAPGGPYQGALASYEYRHCQKRNFWAIGGSLQAEGSRFANYGQGQIKLSGAFHYRLAQDVYAAVGAGGGALQYGAALQDLRYDAQFVQGLGYNPALGSGEAFDDVGRYWQPDLNAGAQLYHTRQGWVVGMAWSHLNRPKFSFLGKDNFLGVGLALQGTATVRIASRRALLLRGWAYRQSVLGGNSAQWQALAGGFYKASGAGRAEGVFSVGCLLRLAGAAGRGGPFEALVPALQLGSKQLRFGLSYDMTLRKLATPSSGRVELTMSWVFGEADRCVLCNEF